MNDSRHPPLRAAMRQCIDNCLHCHATCLETLAHCLTIGGEHAEAAHIGLMQDCAQLCATAADLMARGSPHHAELCRLCAAVCRACADDCDRVDPDDAMMQGCAATCRRCADSCDEMASAA